MRRKNSTWRLVALAVATVLLLGTGACTKAEKAPTNIVDANLPKLTSGLEDGKLTRPIKLSGEKFSVLATYSTKYAINSWNITDNKTLQIELKLAADVPDGTIVYVEHFHADVSIMATKAAFNGISQDSMDDSMHGGTEPGFLVTTTYPYQIVFSIDGYSQTLISGWSYQVGDYGAGEISDKRLTEKNLRNKDDGGATGNKITVVFDLLVKYKGDAGFHKLSIADEIAVPATGTA